MYYKVSKSDLSFNEAIKAFSNKNIIRRGMYSTIYDPSTSKLEDLKFSLEEINSNDWNILTIDNEKNMKLEEIQDIMDEINLNIDSRFYDEKYMKINDYWNLFEKQFIDEDLAYNIMKWVYYNKFNMTNKFLSEEWQRDIEGEDIEYTRTDAFIEKACKFLANGANIPLWEGYNGTFGCDASKLVNNFKNYMKGE